MASGTWGGALDRHPLKVRITWTDDVHVHQTGFTLRSAGVNTTSPAEAAQAVEQWVTESFRTLLSPIHRVQGIDVVDMVSFEGHSISPSNLMGTKAVATAAAVPGALCVVVSMKSELRTRYGQARMFWPVVTDTWLDGDLLNTDGRTAFQAVIDDFASRFIGNDATGHNVIGVHGVIPPRAATPSRPERPEIPPSWYDITSLRLNPVVTFLRSRKAGVGS